MKKYKMVLGVISVLIVIFIRALYIDYRTCAKVIVEKRIELITNYDGYRKEYYLIIKPNKDIYNIISAVNVTKDVFYSYDVDDVYIG